MLHTIVGKRGRGKTSLTKELVRKGQYSRIYILDYLGEYWKFSQVVPNIVLERTDIHGFCKRAWDESSPDRRTLIVLDEIDLYGKNNFAIEFLYRYGRHKGLDIIAVARRFYNLPVTVRSLSDELHLFQITEERDLAYLKSLYRADVIRLVSGLPPFHYVTLSI